MKKKVYQSNFNDRVLNELKDILGPENISTKKIDRLVVAHAVGSIEHKWIISGKYPYLPDVVVWPTNREQVSKIVKVANKYKTVIIPYGGGTNSTGATLYFNGGICIDTKKLTKFELSYKNLTATVGVGWTFRHLEDELNRLGYILGHYPQSFQSSVVGGGISTIAIGTFSTKYGKMDDLLVALEAVLPTGEIIKTTKAPKASQGLNLNYLFLGAEGALGVVTEATLKIWPKPEVRKYMVYIFNTTHDGLEAIRNIMRSGIKPAVVRLYDEWESESKIEKFGYKAGYVILYLGFEGRKDLVELEMKISDECCSQQGGIFKGDEAGYIWEKTRFDTTLYLKLSLKPNTIVDTMEVSAPWDKIEDIWNTVRNALTPFNIINYVHFSHFYQTGAMAYIIMLLKTPEDLTKMYKTYRSAIKTTLDTVLKKGGTISHHHGIGTQKAYWMKKQHGAGFDVMKKIKKLLDPNNIMNPPIQRLGGDANVREL